MSPEAFLRLVAVLSSSEELSMEMTLDEAGVDSLAAMELISMLETAGVHLEDALVASWRTLADIYSMHAISGGFSA